MKILKAKYKKFYIYSTDQATAQFYESYMFGFLRKLSNNFGFCFVFFLPGCVLGFFCFKACFQQIQQNRLKSSNNNYYAIESSLHYLSHCIAIFNSISSFQSIHSQKGCSFCSLCNCYNINPEVI